MKRRSLIILLAATTLLLTGCFSGPVSGSSSAPSGDSTAAAPSATPSPSTPASATATETAGTCTAGAGGDGREIPVVYTVFGPAGGEPVTVTFTSFNSDGSLPATTVTFSGPVFTRVGYACTDAAQAAIWTLTASSITSDAVGCVLDFGGKLVNTDSAYLEVSPPAATTADCSGNPGV